MTPEEQADLIALAQAQLNEAERALLRHLDDSLAVRGKYVVLICISNGEAIIPIYHAGVRRALAEKLADHLKEYVTVLPE
jgi:hypothetical protein